ncbi:hypothetical protein [Ruegeria sp.]|uniref:hypothetical protein n=1 Tax=Ruegeria sp. TaxID=1879320 RepID=UPI003B00EFD6
MTPQHTREAEAPAATPFLPPTDRQLRYARRIAAAAHLLLPWAIQQDRKALSEWIEANEGKLKQPEAQGRPDTPSSRQVGYAERIACARGRTIPDECYRSRSLLSRWIDANGW